jgi:uncharacterized membrane protein YidH (DUF202 family)
MPHLEPLSRIASLHDSSALPLPGTPHSSIAPSAPKQQLDRDMGRLMRDVTAPLKLSLVLENKGNVARDHLASERTYLAYVRTSLATASAGVGACFSVRSCLRSLTPLDDAALVQLFTLSSTTSGIDLTKFAKPLGASIILFGLLILVLGTYIHHRVYIVDASHQAFLFLFPPPQASFGTLPRSSHSSADTFP